MPPKTITSNPSLGETIKNSRLELNLTIEEAASKAGVGTKTWSRYESGKSIRSDKVSGLCKALKWKAIPQMEDVDIIAEKEINEYKKSEAWPPYLAERFGEYAALSFVIGSDILLDEINEDLAALSEMPKGSHIGEVPSSFVSASMPEQFLMRYDYEFMWALRKTLIRFRKSAPHTDKMLAHSVLEELVLYLIVEESRCLMEEIEFGFNPDNEDEEDINWDDWAFALFDDMDIVTFLYSDFFLLTPADTYHFDNWFEQQFYIPKEEEGN